MANLDRPDLFAPFPFTLFGGESVFDRAMRVGDIEMRCYAEEMGKHASLYEFERMDNNTRYAFFRLPRAVNTGLPRKTFCFRTYDNRAIPISRKVAAWHPFEAYRCVGTRRKRHSEQ